MPDFETFDGIRLSYDVVGDGDPVLLLHGFAADSYVNWVQPGVVGALIRSGYSAITLDARGHGRSDKPHEETAYANGAMVKDVRAFLDELALQSCILLGYSMGGLVTLALLPDEMRIEAAVIGGLGGAVLRSGLDDTEILDRTEIADALVADDPSGFGAHAREYRSFAEATKADRFALAAAMRAGRSHVDPSVLKQVETPTLVICGDRDTLGDPKELADALGNGQSVVVEGDHLSTVNDPRFVQSIVDFLSEARARA